MARKKRKVRKLGFAQAVMTAADRGGFNGEWMGFMERVNGRNALERVFSRLINGLQYQRDESGDRYVMDMADHSRLCHLELDGGGSKGHPAYYRQLALLREIESRLEAGGGNG